MEKPGQLDPLSIAIEAKFSEACDPFSDKTDLVLPTDKVDHFGSEIICLEPLPYIKSPFCFMLSRPCLEYQDDKSIPDYGKVRFRLTIIVSKDGTFPRELDILEFMNIFHGRVNIYENGNIIDHSRILVQENGINYLAECIERSSLTSVPSWATEILVHI